MTCRALPLLAAATLGCAGYDPGSLSEPIVGGSTDSGNDYPVVMVQARTSRSIGICTGSLIGKKIVMTAGHCIEPDSGETFTVWFADSYDHTTKKFSGLVDDVTRTAVKVYRHPQYREIVNGSGGLVGVVNDLALLVMDQPAPDSVKPVPYTRYRLRPMIMGQTIRMVGYGDRLGNQSFALFEKLTATNMVDEVGNDVFTVTDSEQITCQGDSGGPAFWEVDGREVVAGITSYGDTGCNSEANWARVDNFIDEIDAFLEQNEPVATANCGGDGICGTKCSTPDPDCPCVADGKCTTACATPDLDPDCPAGCEKDGQCAPEGCPTRDTDCGTAVVGATCAKNSDCSTNICVPKGGASVCTQKCGANDTCPSSFSCDKTSATCLPGGGGGGCFIIAGQASHPSSVGGLLVLLSLLAVRRRRRRPSSRRPS